MIREKEGGEIALSKIRENSSRVLGAFDSILAMGWQSIRDFDDFAM